MNSSAAIADQLLRRASSPLGESHTAVSMPPSLAATLVHLARGSPPHPPALARQEAPVAKFAKNRHELGNQK